MSLRRCTERLLPKPLQVLAGSQRLRMVGAEHPGLVVQSRSELVDGLFDPANPGEAHRQSVVGSQCVRVIGSKKPGLVIE